MRNSKSTLMSRRDLDFLLYEWLDVPALLQRPAYREYDRESVDALIDLAEELAEKYFAPHSRRSDLEEPQFHDGVVTIHDEVGPALEAYFQAGFGGLGMPADVGGAGLPLVVAQAADLWFSAANIATAGYPFLTKANANLLLTHGTQEQIDAWVCPMVEGRFFGTMCLSEPQAGSSLADVRTEAERQPDGTYRIRGSKMWISGGDHELSENIVHLVLARVVGAPEGVKGLSLFIVPKFLEDGTRNDVVLAGLNHKMGMRGITNTVLNFGERDGAQGFLVGEENRGLTYMFHMMNEARVGVGTGAVALGYTGYLQALEYARSRPQGRPLGADPAAPMVPIIEHSDVRRMLLASKAYVEGGLALELYCGRLLDEVKTGNDAETAQALLDVLTPIAKSWPSQWCLVANDHAIQVHGGYGYTRDYPVEQLWRDNRLNPIHEGTHGIQALDLLGRRALQNGGRGLQALAGCITNTIDRARTHSGGAASHGEELGRAKDRVLKVTEALWKSGDARSALANATLYLEAVGHVVVAWLWLDMLLATDDKQGAFYEGKRAAAAYFYKWELPQVAYRLDLLESLDSTLLDLDPATL